MVDRDTVNYRDTSSFDDSSLQDVQTIKSAILHKQYGKDVRSALAQLPDSLIKLFGDTGGNSNAEVEEARGEFETLGLYEQAQNAGIDKVTVEVQNARTNSSSKTYPTLKERMDNQENDLNNNINSKLAQISAVPEAFANLAALKTKYPTGKAGLFVTADTGHKYIWVNGSWTDAGAYQSSGISKNSIEFDRFETNIRKHIFQGISTPSVTYARGVFNSNFSVTDTASWSFFLYRVKKDDYFLINTINDGTFPSIMSFDEKLNLISSQNSMNINKYTIPEDGYLAVNMYMDLGNKTGIDRATVKISGFANGKFNRKSLIADESTLNYPGYINITDGTISSSITPKDGYATTDFISVVPNSYVLVNAMIGTGSGVIGYDSNKNAVSILSKSVNGNEYSDNKFINIPSNVSFIRISTDTSVPFAVYETKVSKKDYAAQGWNTNVSVSPIGAYNGIEKINSAYPNGNDGIVLNTADGYWYYWQDGSWRKGAIYPISDKRNLLGGVTEVNFPAGSPLDYTYYRQFGRRDFYNDSDSFGIYESDFSTDVFKPKSNINNIAGNSKFTVSQSNGKILFNNPTANGITASQVYGYFPFSTSRLKIDTITGSAKTGLIFGDLSLTNYLAVKVGSSSITGELVLNGAVAKSVQFGISSPNGKTLQVQNTGRALIAFIGTNDQYTEVGRFEFGNVFDGRKEKYTDIWKTFMFASTDSFSSTDSVLISGFNTGIRSGSNSVSIRFLTYEDGTFIQKGNYMYFLVEGTGQTISDLFTQIVRINFKTYEVQSIGAIFELRADGVDEGVLLGDDSIKVVYDRYDQVWKGISNGMEYNDYGNSADRPKLYFETKQNLLEGGIIIVRNAVQVKDILGKNVGTSQTTYSEDFDFYYDANEKLWHITGNMVSGGYIMYTSPNLKNQYTTQSVITSVPAGVRDTGNQFVDFGGTKYITTGGASNNLGLRAYDGTYLGPLNVDVPLSPLTNGPWTTLVPFLDGDKTQIFLLSFDRVDLLQGSYDHGGLYCWKASVY
ncbi:hypothetical protein [Leuconostoc lactis]|uniref:hypothetical protein n=1 Tax=Leuconostoc lactis TaxID=1246 RepID=UPI00265D2443|nr:hypothetical protein [Leuconostoc lactis]